MRGTGQSPPPRGRTGGRGLVLEDVVHEESGQLGLQLRVGRQQQRRQRRPPVLRQLRPEHQQQVAQHHERLGGTRGQWP